MFNWSNKRATDRDTICLVDKNVDHSDSIFKQLVSSGTDAFSRPSLICNYIEKIPADKKIRIIINTLGGELVHCEKILKKLLKHESGYTAYIRNECYSAGAIIALGADEIVMTNDSYIGKIDPQSNSEEQVIWAQLENKYIDSKNIYKVNDARHTMNYMNKILGMIYEDKTTVYDEILSNLVYSELPHCALFDKDECKEFGLKIREPLEDEKIYFSDNIKIVDYRMT